MAVSYGDSPLLPVIRAMREMRIMQEAFTEGLRFPSLDDAETAFFARQLEVMAPAIYPRVQVDAMHEGRAPDLGEESPSRLARRRDA